MRFIIEKPEERTFEFSQNSKASNKNTKDYKFVEWLKQQRI